MRSVEPTYTAIGRGDPQQAAPILVDVFHLHPSQPVEDGVLVS